MSREVNGITADPLAKVAQVLTSHREQLDDHRDIKTETRLCNTIEEGDPHGAMGRNQ